jgi:hypothetical protein
MKIFSKFVLVACFVSVAAVAQNEDRSVSEVTEILCSGKWKVDYILIKGEKNLLGMSFEMKFSPDGTYETHLNGTPGRGKWKFRRKKTLSMP